MSAAAFIAKMGISRLGKLGDQITTALVQFDPATASQVQIDDMARHCQELAARISQAQAEEEKSHRAVMALEAQVAQTSQAAQILGDRLKAAPDGPNAAALNKQINTLMDTLEKLGGPEMDGSVSGALFDARQDHAQAEADMHEWETIHAGAVESLTTARRRLDSARHDMERATQAEARERERQAQAERDVGLKAGLDTQNIALSAMEKAATEAKQRARAAQINTDAIKKTRSDDSEDIVKQTLAAAVTSTPVSALDRLARLNQRPAVA